VNREANLNGAGPAPLLRIEDLHVEVAGKPVLRGLNLTLPPGEVHALMGPNGTGKSTLGYVLAGREGYRVTAGRVEYRGEDLLARSAHERALAGIFLAFQYPVEIPGVNNTYFLRAAFNAQRRARGEPELDSMAFLRLVRERLAVLDVGDELLKRAVNEGFSGGEKKRNEIFQMAVLEPTLAILDETDSGLDIDALKSVAAGVNRLRSPERSFLLITHYQRLLEYIVPDRVHILADGRIVESGDADLARRLEAAGYAGWRAAGSRDAA
jgi:Fe-S cluster assembly ATP-binding protein